MDGDGELRLTIMATLAQEESRKVSERVKAGQQVSRENGRVYGCGNILGYDRQGDTYVINPEQAETVRMIYDLYLGGEMGAQKIANELIRRGRRTATGTDKWTIGNVTRILANRTYTGSMAYGKSYSNNYLEQKRIPNHDASTYWVVKSDFPAIISEEDFEKCRQIRESRTVQTMKKAIDTRKKHATHGTRTNHDLWGSLLQCSCGASFRKNRWHKNKGQDWTYGYKCYNQSGNGSASQRIRAGADPTGYCDMGMIADWKLDMMCEKVLEKVWGDRRNAIDLACRMIQESFRAEPKQDGAGILEQLERLKRKKERLVELYTEDGITKEEFAAQKERIGKETDRLNRQLEEIRKQSNGNREEAEPRWTAIRETLTELADITPGHVSEELVKKLVAKVIPSSPTRFRWVLRLDGTSESALNCTVEGRKNRAVVILDDGEPSPDPSDPDGVHRDFRCEKYAFGTTIGSVIHEQNKEKMSAPDAWHPMWSGADLIFRFEIGFEEAEAWRKRRGQYLRRNAYETIEVEVVI